MHLTARHEFPAPPERVHAMSVDPAFLERACLDVGALEHTVEVLPGPDGEITRVSLVTETVPAMRALAGGTLTVGQEMTWGAPEPDGSRDARLLIKVAGLPVAVDARARLGPTASGSAIDYAGELSVDVPLVGGLIEKQAAPFVLEVLEIQQATGNRWLAEHP